MRHLKIIGETRAPDGTVWVVAEKGIADSNTLTRYRDAWEHAAEATPHGQPIELKPEYFEP